MPYLRFSFFFFFYLKERESQMHCHLPAMGFLECEGIVFKLRHFKVRISNFDLAIRLVESIFILKKFKTV
jgi:hypothetical protein